MKDQKLKAQARINPSLENMQRALELLNFKPKFKTIHIAGTNGKGSVCTFLELFYLKAKPELKVAKYISPHLVSVTERFSVDAKNITQDRYDDLYKKLPDLSDLTYFEELTLLAFEYFNEENVDIAILETGLGGRWDATNIIPTENRIATSITNISMDHMDYLGDTLEAIRKEKEAIKRDGVPHFEPSIDSRERIASPNSYLGENFNLALEIFQDLNDEKVSEDIKIEVLSEFNMRYPARLDFNDEANVLLDSAHNPASMITANNFIKNAIDPSQKKIFILAFLDKDYQSCIRNLFNEIFNPEKDQIIVTEIDNERSTKADDLHNFIKTEFAFDSIIDYDAARALKLNKNPEDVLIVAGSVMLTGLWIDVNS